jgi:hypothetical protein
MVQPEQSSLSRPGPSRPWQPQRRRAAGGQRRRGRGGRREKGLYFSYTLFLPYSIIDSEESSNSTLVSACHSL